MSSTNQIKCGGCGAVLKKTDKVCSYCGTENSEYVSPNPPSNNESRALPDKVNNNAVATVNKNKFNGVLFVILLILWWPGAIIYLIVYGVKNKK